MMPTAPTDSPQMLAIANISATSITASWQGPSQDQHNGIIRHYAVVLQESASGAETTWTSLGTSTTIPGLRPFTSYSCKVAAYTVSLGPYSALVYATTLQDGK